MDEIDWRIKAASKVVKETILPWNGHVVKKGERIKLVSVIDLSKKKKLTIPVPDLTALYINSSSQACCKYLEIRKTNKINTSLKSEISFKNDSVAFDAIEQIAVAVITAYSAIESFCNSSIPQTHEFWHHKRSDIIFERSSKEQIERYFSTSNKLNSILPEIYKVDSPKGKSPIWVSYKKLKDCRDNLIHAKSNQTGSVGSGSTNLWDKLFKLRKPHLLAKDVFKWYLQKQKNPPMWYENYPK